MNRKLKIYQTKEYQELSKYLEGEGVDKDILNLVTLLNCIDGIDTVYSCAGTHGEVPKFYVMLDVELDVALFFFNELAADKYNGFRVGKNTYALFDIKLENRNRYIIEGLPYAKFNRQRIAWLTKWLENKFFDREA